MQYAFYFDPSRCAQCFACEVACKSVHDLRPHSQEVPGSIGPRYRQVVTVADVGRSNAPLGYVSMSCLHCGSPTCMAACPTGAIYREKELGVVLVNRARCTGCRFCLWACEFGAPQFDRDGLMQKCDLCIDRLTGGDKPACVEACCGGALLAGPIEELETKVRHQAAGRITSAARPHLVMAVQR